jgi:hypothetical protein
MRIPALGPTATASSTAGSTYLLAQNGAPLWLIATITTLGIGITLITITGTMRVTSRATWGEWIVLRERGVAMESCLLA